MNGFDYMGEAVNVLDNWQFSVPSLEKIFDSAREARDAIEKAQEQKRKLAKPTLALDVISSALDECQIVGIHAGHGHKVVKPRPQSGRFGDIEVFPRVPWIIESLKRLKSFQEQVDALARVLRRFELSRDNYQDNQVDLADRYAAVEAEHAEKTKAAQATTLEKELAKAAPA